jgi:large subunit ribosomal protein L5e
MGFVKVVKNKSYYKRYQVKYRRRREAKTDYYARHRLIQQDKNKYKTPKYRFVVRKTHRDIICQIFSSDLTHDVCIASAYSHELKRYGIKFGSTNYAASYATGLLLARRVNAKFKLDYEGQKDVDGEDFTVEADGEKKPFKALLDVGLQPTTTGARIFGALKGACDGGLDVPHSPGRFPGSSKEGKEVKTEPETHKKYIFGGHVAAYMEKLKEEDEEAYNRQFSSFIEAGITADQLESVYKKAHEAIRADPFKKRDAHELGYFKTREKAKDANAKIVPKKYNKDKISVSQRKNRIAQKLKAKGVKEMVVDLL